jgi:hypothetical protein
MWLRDAGWGEDKGEDEGEDRLVVRVVPGGGRAGVEVEMENFRINIWRATHSNPYSTSDREHEYVLVACMGTPQQKIF